VSPRQESPEELAALLEGAAAQVGVVLTPPQVQKFLVFLEQLAAWSAKVSLTAIREPRQIVLKHFVDSLAALPHLSRCASLLDVGSGPGLPGLAAKIARPALRLVSVESRRRKVSFQEHVVRTLALDGVEIIWGRLEPGCGLLPEASMDCAISRALTLADFASAAAPFVAPGGLLVAMKGRLAKAPLGLPPGLALQEEVGYRLPLLGDERTLLIFRKLPEPC
jgi:16S rRNA (guanine527-N7)-methyltransferase